MIRKIFSLSVIFIFIFSINVYAHRTNINISGTEKYKSIRLTPEIYNNANSDLSDILIKNAKDENVPYFINSVYKAKSEEKNSYSLELINSYLKDDNYFFDYKADSSDENIDIEATSISISAENINFAKTIELFGSYDNKHWEKIISDSLYNVDGHSKSEIIFNKPEKYIYYRFQLNNNLENISFTDVKLNYNKNIIEETDFSETMNPKFEIEEENKETVIKIEGVRNLKIKEVLIETDSMFKRNAYSYTGQYSEIYNLMFGDTKYKNLSIPISSYEFKKPYTSNTLYINIINNDDMPIEIKNIKLIYFADEIVFDGSGDTSYNLEFGANPEKKAPIYDIESYKSEILKNEINKVELDEIIFENTDTEHKEEINYTYIFNFVIIVISIILGIVILLNLK